MIIRDATLFPDLASGIIDSSILKLIYYDFITKIEWYEELYEYYKGEHPILEREMADGRANNTLVCNHAKYITDMAVGYLIGEPIQYATDENNEAPLEIFKGALKSNDTDIHDMELSKDISIYGVGYELHYMDEDANPKIAKIKPNLAFLVVDDTVEFRPLFGVHCYAKYDAFKMLKGYVFNIYTDAYKIECEMNNIESDITVIRTEPHSFGCVPLIEFRNNEEYQGDFEQVIWLIDGYNTLMSDRVNDKEDFIKAYLLFKNINLQTAEESPDGISDLTKFKEQRAITVFGENAGVEYIVKNLTESDVQVLAKAVSDDIHKFSMVPNMTDQNFVGNSSGVAMRYKLLGFESLTKIKERNFRKGINKRKKLITNIMKIKNLGTIDPMDISETFSRSLPQNDVETATMISTLQPTGVVSVETLAGQLSFINDPKQEVEKAKKESAERAKEAQQAFSFNDTGTSSSKDPNNNSNQDGSGN